jgi:protein-S-isoprenylcysteine O-methyltransferase Ste14
MAVCSKCLKRLIVWTALTVFSIAIGLLLDLSIVKTTFFPVSFRIFGIIGLISVHFLLKRTGQLLRLYGDCRLWGWSRSLIIKNVYKCVRHPHHLGVGLFMTFLGMAIGYPFTFIVIIISQWAWVFLFVIFIEEKECLDKFGEDYVQYRQKVPMFFGNPVCIIKELLKPLKISN